MDVVHTNPHNLIGLFLSKWLETFGATDQSEPLSQEEQRVHSLVHQTLYEANPAVLPSSNRPLSIQIMATWATVFTKHKTWGVVSVLGSAMQMYASLSE